MTNPTLAQSRFLADLVKLVHKHHPQAEVTELHGVVTCITTNLVPPHKSILLEPDFPVLAQP